jgi:hypothetical protein
VSALHLLEKLWVRYPCAIHGRAIVAGRRLRQTSIIMEATDTKPSLLKGEGKSEKLSLLVLGICIAALVTILIIRPF